MATLPALPGNDGALEALHQPQEEQPKLGMFDLADDDLVKRLRTLLKEAVDHNSKRRKAREREWAALANDQWESADRDRMSAQGRTTLTLNLLQTMIAAVEGEERSNRQQMKFYGEEEGDDVSAAAWNRLLKWVMDQCGGEFSLSSQFRAGAAVGEGWVVPDVDYFDDPDGQVKLNFVEEDEMYCDPLSTDPTAADARHVLRAQMQDEDLIDARWPGKVQDLRAKMFDGGETEPDSAQKDIYLTANKINGPKVYDKKEKQWLVVEAWWKQIEPGWVVVNEQTGMLDEVSDEDFQQMKLERSAAQRQYLMDVVNGMADPTAGGFPRPLQAKQRPIRHFYQAFFCGSLLLEKRRCAVKGLRRFPYVRFGAIFDKKERHWYGLLMLSLDVQRQHNVEQSAIVQLIQQLPQASWMGPKGSFHNKNEWETKLAKPGRLFEYNAQRGKPEQIVTPAVPRHLIDLAMSRPQQLREITGVNTEMTGQRQASDAGVVMEMRKAAAQTVMAPIFDNYRRSKLEVGKVLFAYMQEYIPVGQRLRVLGQEKAGWVEMTTDMKQGRFDLKVEEANDSINDRIETLTVLQTTLPMLLKQGVPLPPEIVDLLPMNPDLRAEMKRMISWQLTIQNALPPPDWQPGMPAAAPALAGAPSPSPAPAPAAPSPGAPPVQQ